MKVFHLLRYILLFDVNYYLVKKPLRENNGRLLTLDKNKAVIRNNNDKLMSIMKYNSNDRQLSLDKSKNRMPK